MLGLRLPSRAQVTAQRPVLSVRGLSASYGTEQVLSELDLELQRGEIVALLGANGSGKSTTIRCLAGLHPSDAGEVTFHDERGAARPGSVVFQQPHLVRRRTALDNVCSGALGRLPLHRSHPIVFPADLRVHGMHCLDRVGLADRAGDRAGRLSGGQQQRVAVARALCQKAAVILADEPVSALDPAAAEQVMALLADLAHADRLAVLVVLHQPELARRYADRVIGLRRGRAVFNEPAARLAQPLVESLYVRAGAT